MKQINIEIKAKCKYAEKIRKILFSKNADFKGTDHQIDIYFKVKKGRLKLREGKIENALIYYERKNENGPKQSSVIIFPTVRNSSLKDVLEKSLDVLVTVDKSRKIYSSKLRRR